MKLDAVQQAIVDSHSNKIMVVAGAGSGKTRVLTERVKRLLNDGVEPSNIVVITFTNMAADEMRERLADIPSIGDAFIGTIHSFANKLMQNSDEKYEIYSEDRENSFMQYLIKHYCHSLTYDRFLENKDWRRRMETGIISEEEYNDFLMPSERAELTGLFSQPSDTYPETIDSLCRANNVITFDDLLKKATAYFKSLDAQVEHVLVDELQDIGYLEYKFIKGLNAANYFFVGDDWQAIYSFKGGDVKIFLNLIKNPEWTTFYLTTNYRSKQEILDKAQIVIDQAGKIIPKDVKVHEKGCGEVIVASKHKLTNFLRTIPESEFKDYFFLVRTNKQLFEVAAILNDMEIPYSTFKKGDFTLSEIREELNKNTIKLLTVHTSKGLESKNVILYGNFPVKQPHYMNNPEERKVMYVGMTRAMDKLIILN